MISFIQKKKNKFFSSAIFGNDRQNWSRGGEKFGGDNGKDVSERRSLLPGIMIQLKNILFLLLNYFSNIIIKIELLCSKCYIELDLISNA